MLKEAIATGDTVVQAFENACNELGVATTEAECEVLQMPEKKFLGLFGGSPAKVRAFIKTEPAKAAAEYLEKIFKQMNILDTQIRIEETEENAAKLVLTGNDIGFIIGHRGETLDALQYLAGLVANHVDNSYYRITLDVENYREKRKETLEKLGRRMAEKSLKNKRNYSLEPMNPYERRIIHTAVQEVSGAKSWSEGEENNRHVVIGPESGEVRRRSEGKGRGGNYRGGRRGGDRRSSQQKGQPRDREKTAQQAQPVQNKKDAGTTALYGRIEVK